MKGMTGGRIGVCEGKGVLVCERVLHTCFHRTGVDGPSAITLSPLPLPLLLLPFIVGFFTV